MGKSLSMVKEYAVIAFTLLGVLFGMVLMTFIFGQLGHSNNLADVSATKLNESENQTTIIAFLNQTGYRLIPAGYDNYTSASITRILASVDTGYPYNVTVPASNYTLNSLGVLRNATSSTQANISIDYTFNYKSEAEMNSRTVENNSLNGIVTYTNNSSTQFNTVSIAIILILLIGVFLIFWGIFVANKRKKASNEMGGNFA